MMTAHEIVSREEWLIARRELLQREKTFTRQRDALSQARRELPWVKIDKSYVFETDGGQATLAELFGVCSQLIVYHFMYGPEWDDGCPSCSFWADNFNNIPIHLKHRDITFLAISRAPLTTLQAYKKRMQWTFDWASSVESDFNRDFHVSFSADELQGEVDYNYGKTRFPADEAPGISVFCKNSDGEIFHSYSCYARGLDMLNGAYHYMDLVPKGRDEGDLEWSMAWLRRNDQYRD
jgi:predicted dithiol-disulfide oxidoreductase (DUF899 family)